MKRTIGSSLVVLGAVLLFTALGSDVRRVAATTDYWAVSPHCTARRSMDFDADHPLVGLLGMIDSANPYVDAGATTQELVSLIDTNHTDGGKPQQFIAIGTEKNYGSTAHGYTQSVLGCLAVESRHTAPIMGPRAIEILTRSSTIHRSGRGTYGSMAPGVAVPGLRPSRMLCGLVARRGGLMA